MEPTLDAALKAVLGGVGAPTVASPRTIPSHPEEKRAGVDEARDHYRAALESLRASDWPGFGREMEALGKILERDERLKPE
jgi:uncharacterized membrane protein (UPF0182 family)